jgi:hypothetical protein
MFHKVQLIVSNLTSEIRALAHPMRDCHACFEAWLLARLRCIVVCTKFDVFQYSDKLGE